MLANLQQIPPLVWIIAFLFIIAVTGIVFWARRRKFSVTKVKVSAGPLEAELEPGKTADPVSSSPPAAPSAPPSVNISGNWLFGRNKVSVRREKTNIADNVLAGENEIEVGAKPGPKPKAKKGKQRK